MKVGRKLFAAAVVGSLFWFPGSAEAADRTVTFRLSWQDNSDNEAGFIV